MNRSISPAGYQALAEFRYQIRCYLNTTEQAARDAGLEPQQYQVLLAIRGLPPDREATIGLLAERLLVRHHSAVELVDRLARRGLVRRTRGKEDRRTVFVRLTPRGKGLLDKLAAKRLAELRNRGPVLVRALEALIAASRKAGSSDGGGRPS